MWFLVFHFRGKTEVYELSLNCSALPEGFFDNVYVCGCECAVAIPVILTHRSRQLSSSRRRKAQTKSWIRKAPFSVQFNVDPGLIWEDLWAFYFLSPLPLVM